MNNEQNQQTGVSKEKITDNIVKEVSIFSPIIALMISIISLFISLFPQYSGTILTMVLMVLMVVICLALVIIYAKQIYKAKRE